MTATAVQQVREHMREKTLIGVSSILDPYFLDPAAFIQDCFKWKKGEEPAEYQLAAAAGMVDRGRLSLRGPHGLGKTALASWLILWFALTRDGRDWKVVTTASVWRQLTRYLWPEVEKWSRLLDWDKIGRAPFVEERELQKLSLNLTTGSAFAAASNNPAYIEGAHADHLLYVFDEAKTIPAATFDAAEGAFASVGKEAYAIAISTPGVAEGRFYDIQKRNEGFEDWAAQHVSFEQAAAAGRVSREWAAQRLKMWGENNPLYINRVLGDFAGSAEDAVISLSLVEAAVERWKEMEEAGTLPTVATRIGADIARYGKDKTVFSLSIPGAIMEFREYSQEDTVQTTDRLRALLDKFRGAAAIIDTIGIGAGVFDTLRSESYDVVSFNAGARTVPTDESGELHFLNDRAAAWWRFRQLLEEGDMAIPDVDKLVGDLTTPRWRETSRGQIVIESKEQIKKRLPSGRSTDYGDAAIQSQWEDEMDLEGFSGMGTVPGFVSPYA